MRVCFVIGPIGDDGTETHDWADSLLTQVIRPSLEPLEYVVVRADSISWQGEIPHQIAELLVRADLVVADLTEGNPNAFYEIGIRHAIGKPIVHVCRFGDTLPFNVANLRTLFVKLQNKRQEAIRDLQVAAETAVEHPGKFPISQRYRISFESAVPELFPEHLADAFKNCITTSAGPITPVRVPDRGRRRFFIDIAPSAFPSFDALPSIAIDMLLLLIEHLASGSVSGSPAHVEPEFNGYQIGTTPIVVDGVEVPALTLFYTVADDRIVVRRVASE